MYYSRHCSGSKSYQKEVSRDFGLLFCGSCFQFLPSLLHLLIKCGALCFKLPWYLQYINGRGRLKGRRQTRTLMALTAQGRAVSIFTRTASWSLRRQTQNWIHSSLLTSTMNLLNIKDKTTSLSVLNLILLALVKFGWPNILRTKTSSVHLDLLQLSLFVFENFLN